MNHYASRGSSLSAADRLQSRLSTFNEDHEVKVRTPSGRRKRTFISIHYNGKKILEYIICKNLRTSVFSFQIMYLLQGRSCINPEIYKMIDTTLPTPPTREK